MNVVMTPRETWPGTVRTKIVGTTFEGRQDILAECRHQGIERLELIPEPRNRYDPCAIAVCARLRHGNTGTRLVQLGYLSNSERVCSDCGNLVGGSLFERSRKLRCPECSAFFGYDDPVVVAGSDGASCMECPACGCSSDLSLAKVVICPRCGGIDFGRGGLATRMSRALAAGIVYTVRALDYTGGDSGPDGKQKSMGCNIVVEREDD